MPSLNIACATGPVIEFGGRLLRVSPRTIGHLAEIQAQILYLRKDPMVLARMLVAASDDSCKDSVAEACLKTIRHRWTGVSAPDMNRFMASAEGVLLTVCQALDRNDVTREWIYDTAIELLSADELWFYDLLWAMEVASGDADVFELCSIRNVKKNQVPPDYDQYGGDHGLIAVLCSKDMGFTPDEVCRMTFRQARMALAGSKYSPDDDRRAEATEVKKPVNKRHKRLVEESWRKRYTPLIENIIQGKSLFDGLNH